MGSFEARRRVQRPVSATPSKNNPTIRFVNCYVHAKCVRSCQTRQAGERWKLQQYLWRRLDHPKWLDVDQIILFSLLIVDGSPHM